MIQHFYWNWSPIHTLLPKFQPTKHAQQIWRKQMVGDNFTLRFMRIVDIRSKIYLVWAYSGFYLMGISTPSTSRPIDLLPICPINIHMLDAGFFWDLGSHVQNTISVNNIPAWWHQSVVHPVTLAGAAICENGKRHCMVLLAVSQVSSDVLFVV